MHVSARTGRPACWVVLAEAEGVQGMLKQSWRSWTKGTANAYPGTPRDVQSRELGHPSNVATIGK
jgi:hypothetical protein